MKIVIRELFYALSFWVAGAFILEMIFPGMVIAYIKLQIWLLFCVVLGIVIVIMQNENPSN